MLQPRGINIESVLLKAVMLPELLKASIEQKVAAQQDAQRMEFVLQKEPQEAERKVIEASGIARYQEIVSANVTSALLTWKGIEATQALANSPNSKVVLIGNTKDSLPIMLSASEDSGRK